MAQDEKLGVQTKVKIEKKKSLSQMTPQGRNYRIAKMSKSELDKRIRKNAQILNKKITTIHKYEKQGGIKGNFEKTAKARLGAITGTKNVTKIATGSLSRMSTKKKRELLKAQEQLKASPYGTIKGREAMFNKAYESLTQTYGTDISKQAYKRYINFIQEQSYIFSSLMEQSKFDSGRIIEIMNKYTTKQVIKAFNDMETLGEQKIYSIPGRDIPDFIRTYIESGMKDIKEFYIKYMEKPQEPQRFEIG